MLELGFQLLEKNTENVEIIVLESKIAMYFLPYNFVLFLQLWEIFWISPSCKTPILPTL